MNASIQGNIEAHSDVQIASTTKDVIKWLTTIPPETITVTVKNGWLNLGGEVDWFEQRNILEGIVRRLPGVKGVTNSITLKSSRA